MLRYTERANFTHEQIERHVMESIEIADTAALCPADRAVLLPQIFDKLASKQIIAEQFELGQSMAMPGGRP